VAYERFTDSGPLALLPLADGRCTLVLTLDPTMAELALSWSDADFIAEVQRRFGFRLGRFLKVGRRVPYPLSLTRSERTSAGRCVIIGNAAQGLHPVAGMGFNLGLRDVASLAELIAEHRAAGNQDLGAGTLQSEYDAWRAADRGGIIGFTDGLVRVFSNRLGLVQRLRNLGIAGLRRHAAGQSRPVAPQHRGIGKSTEVGARGGAAMNDRRASAGHASTGRASAGNFDFLIVGGGVVGAVMAGLLLARKLAAPGRVAVIDEAPLPAASVQRRRSSRIGTCECSR
jgi:2-polyprenyl-6-methoxyphenol hydroxylase-like FAD-dependent oxidoreductase